jgi:hypothetical protein
MLKILIIRFKLAYICVIVHDTYGDLTNIVPIIYV